MSARWDNHFLHLARLHAEMSKDPNTRVGCVTYREVAEVMSLLDPRSHDTSREAVERCIQHLEREQRDPGVQRTLRALLAERDSAVRNMEAVADLAARYGSERDAAVRDLSAAREILRRLRSWPPSMSCAGTMEGFQAIQAAWLRERREAEAAADAVLAAQPAAKAGVTDREVSDEA